MFVTLLAPSAKCRIQPKSNKTPHTHRRRIEELPTPILILQVNVRDNNRTHDDINNNESHQTKVDYHRI
jgi:hypothetical protein